jgi:hypothetical protein
MSDGESFDEYNNDDNSSLETSSSYAADDQRHWEGSENETGSRGIAYQENSFGMEDDYSRTTSNISGDKYGFGARISRNVVSKIAETTSPVLSEQETNNRHNIDLIATEKIIPEEELKENNLNSKLDKQQLRLQRELGSYNNDNHTNTNVAFGKRQRK